MARQAFYLGKLGYLKLKNVYTALDVISRQNAWLENIFCQRLSPSSWIFAVVVGQHTHSLKRPFVLVQGQPAATNMPKRLLAPSINSKHTGLRKWNVLEDTKLTQNPTFISTFSHSLIRPMHVLCIAENSRIWTPLRNRLSTTKLNPWILNKLIPQEQKNLYL